MTFTTISSAARRSLLGAVVVLALAVAFVASASSAKAATGSPIGKLDSAGGTIGNGVVSGWAADPDVPLYSPIDVRLAVYRSNRHIYAQLIDDRAARTLASASDDETTQGDKTARAKATGKLLAERAKSAGIESAVFDRGGRLYHGRVAALADGAREGGLKI